MGGHERRIGKMEGKDWEREHTVSLRYSEIIRYIRALLCKVRAAVFF